MCPSRLYVECLMQVICNGEEVLTVSGTKEKYVVDVWSGNHPFFKAGPPLSSILSSQRWQFQCGIHCCKVLGLLPGLVCLLWRCHLMPATIPAGFWRAAHSG